MTSRTDMTRRSLVIAFILILGSFLLLVNWLTPIMHDDYAYLYKFGDASSGIRPTESRIENFVDVLKSSYYHYLDVNGRWFSHLLLQTFLFLGESCFNVMNTFVFISVGFMLYYLAFPLEQKPRLPKSVGDFVLLLSVFAALFCLLPFWGQTVLWKTGAVIYLWSTSLVLFVLCIVRVNEKSVNNNVFRLSFLFLLATLFSWVNESITIGLAASLFIYLLIYFRHMSKPVAILVIGFCCGVLLNIVSPASFKRFDNEAIVVVSISEKIERIFYDFVGIVLYLKYHFLIFVVLCTTLFFYKVDVKEKLRENLLLIIAVFVNLVFISTIGVLGERIYFGSAVLLILINIRLFYCQIQKIPSSPLVLFSLSLLIFIGFNMRQCYVDVRAFSKVYIEFEQQVIKNKTNGVFYFPESCKSRFVNNTMSGIFDEKNYHNRVRSFYYGMPTMAILPPDIYHLIFPKINFSELTKTKISGDVYYSKKLDLLLVGAPVGFRYKQVGSTVLNVNHQNFPINFIFDGTQYWGVFVGTTQIDIDKVDSLKILGAGNKIELFTL